MKIPLKLVLLGVALLGVGYVVSLPTNATSTDLVVTPSKNCTSLTFFRVVSCLFRLGEFMGKLYFLNINKQSSLESFHKSCNSLQECIRSVSCGKEDAEGITLANKIESHCAGLQYMFKDFAPCLDKFEKNNPDSKCFETWSPYVDSKKNGTDVSEEEICANFFGDNNCMKKEVTETCSEKEWQGMRDAFVKLTPEVKDCGLENL